MSTPMPAWVANRIVGFFNSVNTVAEITEGPIKDDPADGPGRTIGPVLAARILRSRAELPRRRFTDFSQIDDIRGVGETTVRDLAYSFGRPAAAAFQENMYEMGVIYRENWPLAYFRTAFEDEKAFQELVQDKEALRHWVADRIIAISTEREVPADSCDAMVAEVQTAYMDHYSNSTEAAAFALALWFYRFDADNWFSWTRIQERTLDYFGYHAQHYPWEMELYLFKGFQQRGIIPPGITPHDLPVVVNWPEQSITIWVSALYD